MDDNNSEWSRKNAEKNIADLLDAAKNGPVQKIIDFDGTFEVRFIAPVLAPAKTHLVADGEFASEAESEPGTNTLTS